MDKGLTFHRLLLLFCKKNLEAKFRTTEIQNIAIFIAKYLDYYVIYMINMVTFLKMYYKGAAQFDSIIFLFYDICGNYLPNWRVELKLKRSPSNLAELIFLETFKRIKIDSDSDNLHLHALYANNFHSLLASFNLIHQSGRQLSPKVGMKLSNLVIKVDYFLLEMINSGVYPWIVITPQWVQNLFLKRFDNNL